MQSTVYSTFWRLVSALAAIVGYILSPLSWWNDGFVNIPLAMLAAKLAPLPELGFTASFYLYYMLSNIVGMALLVAGVRGSVRGGANARVLVKSFLVALAYSIAVYPLLRLLGFS